MSKRDAEGKHESKLIRELRKENIKLRREVQQLRKKNHRVEKELEEASFEDEEMVEESKESPKYKCPKCRMARDIYVFELRGLNYYSCGNCGSKGRYN